MKKNVLGRTGLEVTPVSFGGMELRFAPDGDREVTEDMAERLLHAVLDAGINFIDTSPDYGLSEERIGRHISSRREEYFLATKCGCDPVDKGGKGGHIWSRDQLLKNIDGSLKRLKTDHVDVLQLHNPRGDDVPMDELVDALKEIQSQGLARFISVSHTLPWLDELIGLGVFDTYQIPYSCLEPAHHDAITRAAEAGAGIIIRGGIGKGGPEAVRRKRVNVGLWERAGLAELCTDMTPPELILRYTLAHPHFHTTIVGTCDVEHLKANVAAARKGPLDDDLYQQVKGRVAAAQE